MTIGTQTQKVPALRIGRAGRLPWRFAAACLGLLVMAEAAWLAVTFDANPQMAIGMDYGHYMTIAHRWLAGGPLYLPHQLVGPHVVGILGQTEAVDNLYPPSALLLFIPFTMLPALAWWAVPAGIVGYALYRFRPEPWAWAAMLALLAWPRAIGAIILGNTDMWVAAGVAAGLLWSWPALLILLKPTLFPFALVGIRHRTWWLGALLGIAFIAVTAPLWVDYITAMRNGTMPDGFGNGLLYSLGSLPLVCLPLVPVLLRYRIPKRDGQRRRGDDHLEGTHLAA